MENTLKINTKKLNLLRGQKKLTIEQLAKRSGLPHSTVSKIASGYTVYPSSKAIIALADVLGTSPEELTVSRSFEELSQKQREALTNLFIDNDEGEYALFLLSKYSTDHFNKLIPLFDLLLNKSDEDVTKTINIVKIALS